MSETYSPRERIRKKKDFTELYRNGACFRGKYFNVIFKVNGLTHSRMAAVSSRKVGGAVQRNKARRRARTLFRANKSGLAVPMDLLVIAKKGIDEAAWCDVRDQYLAALLFIGRRTPASN